MRSRVSWVIDGREYVIIDGQRIPARIVTPREKPPQDGEKRVEVRDLRAAAEQPVVEQAQAQGNVRRGDRGEPGWWRVSRYGRRSLYYGAARPLTAREYRELYRARRSELRKDEEHQRAVRETDERTQRILSQHERALRSGVQLLQTGETQRAVVALTLAAKLNHGDPACRVHLAQARLALGHYREGGLALRRGLELQPHLVYLDLHLSDYYAEPESLNTYTDKLRTWTEQNKAGWEEYFLLGFFEFQRGAFAASHEAFARVAALRPKDDLAQSYLEITKLIDETEPVRE